jgi:hypothetical protein
MYADMISDKLKRLLLRTSTFISNLHVSVELDTTPLLNT